MTAQEIISKLIEKYEAKNTLIENVIEQNPHTYGRSEMRALQESYKDFISDLKQLQQNTL